MKTYYLLFLLALVVLVSDQASKFWIMETLEEGTYWIDSSNPPITVIEDFFYIVHIKNKGAAWGILSGMGTWLGLLGFVAIGAIFYYRKELFLETKIMQLAFGLLIGGIIGNMIDRFRFKEVVDFLDFHLPLYGRYPAFNIADSGITVGVLVYILFSIRQGYNERQAKRKTEK